MQLLTIYSGQLDMAKLPDLLSKAQAITSGAESQTKAIVEHLSNLDYSALDIQSGDAMDLTLKGWQDWIKPNFDFINGNRTPYTKAFDEVKTTFTTEEKKLSALDDIFKSARNKWAMEKARRQKAENEKLQNELDKKNAASAYKKAVIDAINAAYFPAIQVVLDNMNNGYYAATLATIADCEARLRAYTPSFQQYTYDVAPNQILSGEEMLKIRSENEYDAFSALAQQWVNVIISERDRLIELIPSRTAELQRIATDANAAKEAADRQAQEAADRQSSLANQAAVAAETTETVQAAEQMNHMFENAALAPSIEQTKGAVTKLKYVIKSHKDMGMIMQYWVKNNMHLLTLEELQKKLSFMITAANAGLAKGDVLVGIETEEDINVRRTNAKK